MKKSYVNVRERTEREREREQPDGMSALLPSAGDLAATAARGQVATE